SRNKLPPSAFAKGGFLRPLFKRRPPGDGGFSAGCPRRAGRKSRQSGPADDAALFPEDSEGQAGGPAASCECPPIHGRIRTGFPASSAPRPRSPVLPPER